VLNVDVLDFVSNAESHACLSTVKRGVLCEVILFTGDMCNSVSAWVFRVERCVTEGVSQFI
jgi:hypothetical protein